MRLSKGPATAEEEQRKRSEDTTQRIVTNIEMGLDINYLLTWYFETMM